LVEWAEFFSGATLTTILVTIAFCSLPVMLT
jgi:hypothetical protein